MKNETLSEFNRLHNDILNVIKYKEEITQRDFEIFIRQTLLKIYMLGKNNK